MRKSKSLDKSFEKDFGIFNYLDYIIFDVDKIVLNKEFKDDDYIEFDYFLNVNNILEKNIFIILEINKNEFYTYEHCKKILKNENININIHFKMNFQNVKSVKMLYAHELKIKVFILDDDINNLNESNYEDLNINENKNENFEKKINIFFIYNSEKLLIDKSEFKIMDKDNNYIVIINNLQDKPIYKNLILKKENEKENENENKESINKEEINFININ